MLPNERVRLSHNHTFPISIDFSSVHFNPPYKSTFHLLHNIVPLLKEEKTVENYGNADAVWALVLQLHTTLFHLKKKNVENWQKKCENADAVWALALQEGTAGARLDILGYIGIRPFSILYI